jgi:GNAT superfamily N-acetyltransferase
VVSCHLGNQAVEIILQPCEPANSMLPTYTALQRRVYGHHGVLLAQRVSDACMRSCTHLILARYPGGTLAGGLRVHARSRGPLPVEAALPRSRRLTLLLDRLGEPLELSGMVVAPEARKTGLAALIARAGVAAIPLLHGRTAVGFGHQHVLPLYASVGFVPRRRLGCHHYPDARYLSRVAVLEDAVALTGVPEHERMQIMALRQRLLAGQTDPTPQEGAIP